jgi:DNA polymerase-4
VNDPPENDPPGAAPPGLCRDCAALAPAAAARCPACRSRRLVRHPELHRLSVAHVDCDAFYASVEKRDDPRLADKPVIVGGGRRGVVAACCYVARLFGVRSAMPMFKALSLCPDAVVIPPDMRKYAAVGRQVRAMMRELTPLVEPISIDEAFLDLAGTERLLGGSPARSLARLVLRFERELGITASIGLSHNKFLAKIASDLDKPRGFRAIGRDEAEAFLAPQPVSLIWGVGKALERKLEVDGIVTIADIRARDEHWLVSRYGAMGRRLFRFSRGQDDRRVEPEDVAKSVSAETTFERDIAERDELERRLWPLAETVSRRLKAAGQHGASVVLKLKTADFQILTRSRRIDGATQYAEEIFRVGRQLLAREADGRAFRLIGIGCADLAEGQAGLVDLLDPERERRERAERAMDEVRRRLGEGAIVKGRSLARDEGKEDGGLQDGGSRDEEGR